MRHDDLQCVNRTPCLHTHKIGFFNVVILSTLVTLVQKRKKIQQKSVCVERTRDEKSKENETKPKKKTITVCASVIPP